MTVTFKVDDGENNIPSLYASKEWYDDFLKSGLTDNAYVLSGTVEAHKLNVPGESTEFRADQGNAFVNFAMKAFSNHSPIVFSPDDIWIVTLQALSEHIQRSPEEVRHALVPFEGKKTLLVTNSDFEKGNPNNNWEREFQNFSDQIATYLGKKRDLFDATFSTTTSVEKVAIQIQMMAALSPFFDYRMMTLCGVPTITLKGSVFDWKAIVERVDAAREFYPMWAYNPLRRAVDNFLLAAQGKPHLPFWQNFFKRSYGSGGTKVGGMINAFFPYINGKPNQHIDSSKLGYDVGDYPGSIGSVPMSWGYLGTTYAMRLAAGIVGVAIEDNAYRSVIGWFIGHDSTQAS